MAALTKAAVAEICEVVDEGYAVLQLEITRSHKENEDLKKKLHLIESIVVRGSSGGGGGGEAADAEGPEVSPAAEATQQSGTTQQQREGDGRGAAAGAVREEVSTPPVWINLKPGNRPTSESNNNNDNNRRLEPEV